MLFAQTCGQLLFCLINRLYERTSIIVTLNLAFAEWPSVLVLSPGRSKVVPGKSEVS